MHEIIVGVDDSAAATTTAQRAAALAANTGTPLHIVMAVASRQSIAAFRSRSQHWQLDPINTADQALRALSGAIHASTPVTHTVIIGTPAKALCDEAVRLNASMIAIGNKRVQGAARVFGSIAGDVAKHAPCDVLIIHTSSPAPPDPS
jgi:nucleotide-binding universal stress UspA family protein